MLHPKQAVLALGASVLCISGLQSPSVAAGVSTTTETVNVRAAAKYGWGPIVAGDEFTYTGAPKSSKWNVYNSVGHNGHGYRRPSAWNVNGTAATVTGDSAGTTGGMSARFGHQKYGRWEVRQKTNARDSKYHPALLLWPDVPTPSTCPEVDFAESTKDTTKIKFFLHYGCAPQQTSAFKYIDTTQWHNYAVEWSPTHITGYIDGVQYFKDSNQAHLPKGAMHQALQLDWFPNGTVTKKSTMSIAWVRVYKLS